MSEHRLEQDVRAPTARWVLLKNPTDLTDEQAVTLRKLKRQGGELWRAYALGGAARGVRR